MLRVLSHNSNKWTTLLSIAISFPRPMSLMLSVIQGCTKAKPKLITRTLAVAQETTTVCTANCNRTQLSYFTFTTTLLSLVYPDLNFFDTQVSNANPSVEIPGTVTHKLRKYSHLGALVGTCSAQHTQSPVMRGTDKKPLGVCSKPFSPTTKALGPLNCTRRAGA